MSEKSELLEYESQKDFLIYSDGACSGNPGPGGWGAILIFQDEVRELSGRENSTTNNRMEMTGAISALDLIVQMEGSKPGGKLKNSNIFLFTDSSYIINGIDKWVWGWIKNNWRNKEGAEVLNADLWKLLYKLTHIELKARVNYRYVRGHRGHAGNERCDEMAVSESKFRSPIHYIGNIGEYSFEVIPPPPFEAVPQFSSNIGAKKAPPFGYISLVDGVFRRHKDWSSCERLVKGRAGAKFKKAQSAEDEAGIVKSWGYDLKSITILKDSK